MKTSIKNLLFVCVSLLFSIPMSAQNVWSVSPSPIKIEKGGTVVVDINLNMTTSNIRLFSFKFKTPDGVTLSGCPETGNKAYTADGEIIKAGERLSGLTDKLRINYIKAQDVYKVGVNLGSGNVLKGETGTDVNVFSIKLEASSEAVVGSESITISELQVLDEDNNDVTSTFDNPSISIVEPATTVDITLANTDSYNSYCCDKDLDVSGVTDAKFYVVSSITASEATLTQVTTGIPAGEGFLIQGSGTANISVPVAATAPTATGSKLVGVTAATDIEAGNYILKSDGSSFVPCTAGTLPANKAYLKKGDVPASAKEFLMIVEDAVVTGINEVKAENAVNGAIYNLNGARVSNPQKGVYIMNGRKVIVK